MAINQKWQPKGPWNSKDVIAFLEETVIPIRLSAINSSGWPVIVSLWFVLDKDYIWCATSSTAKLAAIIRNNDKCAFEIAPDSPPYRGLRGQATATIDIDQGANILSMLVDRYLKDRETEFARWLLNREASEIAIRIDPVKIQSWNYASRMRS